LRTTGPRPHLPCTAWPQTVSAERSVVRDKRSARVRWPPSSVSLSSAGTPEVRPVGSAARSRPSQRRPRRAGVCCWRGRARISNLLIQSPLKPLLDRHDGCWIMPMSRTFASSTCRRVLLATGPFWTVD